MTVPSRVFLHYLERLDTLLQRVAATDPAVAANRLHPDMAPLLQQARTAIGFALRVSCPLAGRAIVSFQGDDFTLEGVRGELARTAAYLATLPAEAFGDPAARQVDTVAGFADLRFNGPDYFLLYGLPNFFFHYSMVYAIARQAGVPVGKSDFDGFHAYPAGFSFPA
ncbi:DUF1993 domain-containing protein [Pseudoduganella umbonata]|uniref:DUF1993 domain-containing protein n=1 Tax=Pseudoduganella umbonata TaxID=864828 RepID=A0A4P8HRX4_9BURK|nr:DUF1993 domain-containing protein [Pseudoduganella umbonata]MBB3222367.1 hypothetical protein [Pseudoduganella umbonata]QCP12583.1 DUF1993 domain-containing protein [Pseudoduganella umbonata]